MPPECHIDPEANPSAIPDKGERLKPRKRSARSRMTNGKQQFLSAHVDGRSVFSRRLYDLTVLFTDDLSGGAGADALSEAQLSLIRRAAVLQMRLEEMEMKMAEGQNVDIDVYARTAGHLRRIFETVGLRRVRKDATPQLHSYVKNQVAREQEQEAE